MQHIVDDPVVVKCKMNDVHSNLIATMLVVRRGVWFVCRTRQCAMDMNLYKIMHETEEWSVANYHSTRVHCGKTFSCVHIVMKYEC